MVGEIYIIKSLNLYKIGRSQATDRRLQLMRVYNPHGLEVVFSARVKHYEKIEKKLHYKYRLYRKSGEWFALNEQQLTEIKGYLLPLTTSVLERYQITHGS